MTDRRTDRQNCYINIARQYADARQSYICALIGPCSFFSNFCVFCTLFLTRAGLRVLGLVRLCVICLFSSILSELRLVVSDASIDSSLCWRVMCRVRRYTRQSLITQCQYGLRDVRCTLWRGCCCCCCCCCWWTYELKTQRLSLSYHSQPRWQISDRLAVYIDLCCVFTTTSTASRLLWCLSLLFSSYWWQAICNLHCRLTVLQVVAGMLASGDVSSSNCSDVTNTNSAESSAIWASSVVVRSDSANFHGEMATKYIGVASCLSVYIRRRLQCYEKAKRVRQGVTVTVYGTWRRPTWTFATLQLLTASLRS